MLVALLSRSWKDTDFVPDLEHGYMCPISVMTALAKMDLVVNASGLWTLTEAGRETAKKLHKRDILRFLPEEPGGKISHKEVERFPALLETMESLRDGGRVERRGSAWYLTGRS